MSLQNVISLKAYEIQTRGGEGFTKDNLRQPFMKAVNKVTS